MRNWTLALAGLLFAGIAVLPVGWMFFISFRTAEGFSLANYLNLLSDARQRTLLIQSLLLSLFSALLASVVGAPLGLILAKTSLRLRAWWRLLLVTPLLLPPYILTIGLIFSVNALSGLNTSLSLGRLVTWIHSLPGAVLVLSLCYYPIPMLFTEAALCHVGPRMEEAAWLVAGWRRTLLTITLPLVLPLVFAGFLLVFVLTLGELSVPSLLGVRVFATEVYTQFSAFFNFGAATATTAPLLTLILILAGVVRVLTGERLMSNRRNQISNPLQLPSNWHGAGRVLLIVVFLFAVCLPVAGLISRIHDMRSLWLTAQNAVGDVINSLILSCLVALLSVGLGLLLGYWRARSKARWRSSIDILWLLLYTVPGTLLGLGLIDLWNRAGHYSIYGTWGLLLLALVARHTPITALWLSGSVRQVSPSLEEAAIIHGASWQRVIFRILVPCLKKNLSAAAMLIFILSFGELALTILLIPPGASTLSLRIFTTITNSPDHVMAALCLSQSLIVFAVLILMTVKYSHTHFNRQL